MSDRAGTHLGFGEAYQLSRDTTLYQAYLELTTSPVEAVTKYG